MTPHVPLDRVLTAVRSVHRQKETTVSTPEPSEAEHCPTCVCGRRAPVQASYTSRDRPRKPAGTVAWWEHEKAWEDYGARYSGQSAERIAERGGFEYWEMTDHLGHEPTTWSVR